jgi:Na+/proline symporter
MEKAGKSIVSNPYVYSLSLAVYCTSWTFYGSVGKAATSGFTFLTIYLGPTLIASLWWIILRKMIGIAKENRITTISDFIGSRYGNSIALSALVTIVAVVGITPYLGLQIKAIMSTFTILSGETRGTVAAGWIITLLLGVFAIIFGARRIDSSERHEGLVFAIAFESIIKLVAFIMVGVFVTYGILAVLGYIRKIKGSEYGSSFFSARHFSKLS